MHITAILGDAGASSSLYEGASASYLLQASKDHQGQVEVVPNRQLLHLTIRTPQFGTSYSNLSDHARVALESPGVYVVCFEDGNDFDYDDLVVRVWNTSCLLESLDAHVDSHQAEGDLRVAYDPHLLVSPASNSYLADAALVAAQVLDEAVSARWRWPESSSRSASATRSRGSRSRSASRATRGTRRVSPSTSTARV
jgi:hypothetical protein